MNDSPWKVGAGVYKDFGWLEFSGPYKIAKIYKNGNFVLEGDTRQWTPWTDTAHPASKDQFSLAPILVLATSKEVPRRLAIANAYRYMRIIESALDSVRRLRSDEAAERVLAAAPDLGRIAKTLRNLFPPIKSTETRP